MLKYLIFAVIKNGNHIIPHGTLANSCSAFWQASAFSPWLENSLVMFSMNVYMDTSKAAELDNPDPIGTLDLITASNEHGFPFLPPKIISFIKNLLI